MNKSESEEKQDIPENVSSPRKSSSDQPGLSSAGRSQASERLGSASSTKSQTSERHGSASSAESTSVSPLRRYHSEKTSRTTGKETTQSPGEEPNDTMPVWRKRRLEREQVYTLCIMGCSFHYICDLLMESECSPLQTIAKLLYYLYCQR